MFRIIGILNTFLGIVSIKVGESASLPIIVSDAALSLLSLSHNVQSSEMNSVVGTPAPTSTAADKGRPYDVFHRQALFSALLNKLKRSFSYVRMVRSK